MTIAAERAALVAALDAADYVAVDHVPTSVDGLTVIIGTADPYIERSDSFGAERQYNLELSLIFEPATGDAFTDHADETVDALLAVLPDGWSWSTVSAPFVTKNWPGRVACRVVISTIT